MVIERQVMIIQSMDLSAGDVGLSLALIYVNRVKIILIYYYPSIKIEGAGCISWRRSLVAFAM